MKKIFALVDCNNFFVSCERVFNPKIRKCPVVVLSNNDGCIVARSNEAKQIGLKMGEPIFECMDLINFWGVRFFSGNYELYNDMSRRVMKVLSRMCENIEIYSIDEAFLDITNIKITSLEEYALNIKNAVYQEVGIPVSVGIGSTKTLAKVASKIGKKGNGVCIINDNDISSILSKIDISDVWGIGFRSRKKLRTENINTALDFVNTKDSKVRKLMGIMGVRTQLELEGFSVYELDKKITKHKSLSYTRSFKKGILEKEEIRKKVVEFAQNVSLELRNESSLAKAITVYIRGNKHKKNYYRNACTLKITPSNKTVDIVNYSIQCFDTIFQAGEEYKKAGIILTDIIDEKDLPKNIFSEEKVKNNLAQKVVDEINTKSNGIIKISSSDLVNISTRLFISNRYTTNWNEIMKVA